MNKEESKLIYECRNAPQIERFDERLTNLIEQNTREHGVMLEAITKIEDKMEKVFVTKEEFTPIKNGFYAIVALILGAVFTALLSNVVRANIFIK